MSRSTDQALSGWAVHLLPSYNALHSQYTLKTFRFEDEISPFFREGKGNQKSISTVVRSYYIYFLLLLFLVGGWKAIENKNRTSSLFNGKLIPVNI